MNTIINKFIFGLVQSLVFCSPLIIITLHQLRRRLSQSIRTIRELRTEGDLRSRIFIGTFDDFGIMMSEMNLLMDTLGGSLSNLKNEIGSVDTSAEELMQLTESSSSDVEQIVTRFKEMSSESNNQAELLASVNDGVTKLNADAVKVSDFTNFQFKSEKENEVSMTDMVNNLCLVVLKLKRLRKLLMVLPKCLNA